MKPLVGLIGGDLVDASPKFPDHVKIGKQIAPTKKVCSGMKEEELNSKIFAVLTDEQEPARTLTI